jgi:hypothetical protein
MPVLLVAAAGISNTGIRQDTPELRFACKNEAVQAPGHECRSGSVPLDKINAITGRCKGRADFMATITEISCGR